MTEPLRGGHLQLLDAIVEEWATDRERSGLAAAVKTLLDAYRQQVEQLAALRKLLGEAETLITDHHVAEERIAGEMCRQCQHKKPIVLERGRFDGRSMADDAEHTVS